MASASSTILSRLAAGDILKFTKAGTVDCEPATYIIAQVSSDISKAFGFTLPSYVMGSRTRHDATNVLSYYNPEEASRLIETLVTCGWTGKAM